MTHDPHCTACPACNREMRWLISLNLDDLKDRERYSRWLTARSKLRTAGTTGCAETRGKLRTNIHPHEEITMRNNDFTAPDIYAAPLAKIRAATAKPPTPDERFASEYADYLDRTFEAATPHVSNAETRPRLTAAELAAYESPDPYAEPLRRMRDERRR